MATRRIKWGSVALSLITALSLCVIVPERFARAESKDTPMIPKTVAPLLTPVVTPSTTETPQATPTVTPTATLVGDSSLDWLMGAETQSAVTETPSPTPTEIPATLPAVLHLADPTVFRVLLIGTDAYSVKQNGRSDAMIVLQLNARTGEIRMVSFLRDLYVQIPDHGKTRLNAAYVYGGAELLKQTLANNFGVTVDRVLAVNFSLMVELVDRIGGVTVEVSEKERKQLNSILKYYNTHNGFSQKDQLLEESGVQVLTGKQALCYSRIRKMDSDFARTNRQRKVLEAVYTRVKTLDALTLADLLNDTLPEVWTDMTLTDAVALVPVLMKLDDVSIQGMTVPVQGGYRSQTISGMMVLVPDLTQNAQAVAAFLEQGN